MTTPTTAIADDDEEADGASDATAGSGDGHRVTDQRTYEAPLWQFLDHCELVFTQYAKHRLTLSQQKAAHLACDRNYRPGMLISDIDFAENYDIIHALEIQSAHWSHKQLTLFISINSYLLKSSWDKEDGAIAPDTHVTVEPNGKGEARGSFFATVVAGTGAQADDIYEVETPSDDGTPSRRVSLPRKLLRHRDEKTVAYVFATGDRKHDTHAVQHFLIEMMTWFKSETGESFTHHFIRSDNAAQHFKSKYTLRFLTMYAKMFRLVHVVWDFGCPGHVRLVAWCNLRRLKLAFCSCAVAPCVARCAQGKGPWDGMGGTLKSWLRRTAEAMPCDRVDRGPEDCAARLKAHFESDEWLAEHRAGTRYKINVIKIHWVADRVIKRPSHYSAKTGGIVEQDTPQNPASVAPLKGGSSHYSFWVVGDEQLAMRRFTCWCDRCIFCNGKVIRRDQEQHGAVRVDGCEQEFAATLLSLTDAASVAKTRRTRHADGESLANRLKSAEIGTRFACATPPHGYGNVSFEIFETVSPARGKPPVVKLSAETTINGIKFAQNRLIVYCRALERLDDDPDGRSFSLSSTVRAVEGRMVRFNGVALEETGMPRASDHDARARRAADGRAEPPPSRRFVLSEAALANVIAECDE